MIRQFHLRIPCSRFRDVYIQFEVPRFRSLDSFQRHRPRCQSRRTLSTNAELRGAFRPNVRRFAQKSSPTLLYQAPSPFLYRTSCYLLASFCFTWAGFNSYNVIFRPLPQQGHSNFAMIGTAGICVFMIGFGSLCLYKSFRILRSVAAVPFTTPSGARDVKLSIERMPIFPGMRPKVVKLPCEAVSASGRLFTPVRTMTMAERVEDQRRREQEHAFLMSRILTMPFRQAAYWIRRCVKGIQGVFFDEEFIFLKLKGSSGSWKMDRNAAWAFEEGRAFDSLVRHHLGAA